MYVDSALHCQYVVFENVLYEVLWWVAAGR